MEENDFLDWGFDKKENRELVSVNIFIILFFLTMGLYGTWWMYKAWRYFKEKEKLDIMPAMRAVFAIFFLYELFIKIQEQAHSRGYKESYSAGPLFIGYIVISFLAQLPEPLWVLSQLALLCLIAPFKAFNYILMNAEGIGFRESEGFNQRQIILLFFGAALWSVTIINFFVAN